MASDRSYHSSRTRLDAALRPYCFDESKRLDHYRLNALRSRALWLIEAMLSAEAVQNSLTGAQSW